MYRKTYSEPTPSSRLHERSCPVSVVVQLQRPVGCGMLLLLLVAQAVDVLSPAYCSIETTELNSHAAQELAVAKLSDGPNQESWWQLRNVYYNESALSAYFGAGPPHLQRGGHGKKDGSSNGMDLAGSLSNSATAMYEINSSSVAGTGRIQARMWTLIFYCPDFTCNQGMVPIVNVGSSQNHSYALLWLSITPSFLVNATPLSISQLSRSSTSAGSSMQYIEESSGISVTMNIQTAFPFCPLTQIATCRSNLDSAYSLLPGFSCVEIALGRGSFRVLVSLANTMLLLGRNLQVDVGSWFTLQDILSKVGVLHWKELPAIEACSEEPLIIVRTNDDNQLDGNDDLLICFKAFCMEFLSDNVKCTGSYSHGVEYRAKLGLKAGLAVAKSLSECVHGDVFAGLYHYPDLTQCSVFATHQYCKSFTSIKRAGPDGNFTSTFSCQLSASIACNVTVPQGSSIVGDHLYIFSPVGNWSLGARSGHTRNLSASKVVKKARPCIHLPQAAQETFREEVPEAILAQAKSQLTSYITEHHTAFTTMNGPATDRYTFVALVVSTAVSVILAVSWPFTNFVLKQICGRRPLHLTCQQYHGRLACKCRVAKACLHMTCNVMLSTLFFLPVLSVVPNELERSNPFYTWDLKSRDLDVLHDADVPNKFRVVYLFSASSRYDSQFLRAIAIVVGLTCLIVSACTAKRCFQIFQRYDLLCHMECGPIEVVPIRGVHDASASAASAQALVQRAFKAIEMTDAKCLGFTKKVGHLSSH